MNTKEEDKSALYLGKVAGELIFHIRMNVRMHFHYIIVNKHSEMS